MSNEPKPIHAGHRARMRSRFFETGLDSFQPHEVLELLLFCVIPKRDVNPLAHALINEFGSIDAVLSASPEDLCKVPGIGRQTGEFFRALNELIGAYHTVRNRIPLTLATLSTALSYVPASARNSLKRGVTVIFADRFNRPLSVRFFPGRPDDPLLIRAVLSKALILRSHNAVIFCTGYRTRHRLSSHELTALQPLVDALSAIDTYALDCILLTETHLFSLRHENMITSEATERQGNLSRWEYWLGPAFSSVTEDHWCPISLFEQPADRP